MKSCVLLHMRQLFESTIAIWAFVGLFSSVHPSEKLTNICHSENITEWIAVNCKKHTCAGPIDGWTKMSSDIVDIGEAWHLDQSWSHQTLPRQTSHPCLPRNVILPCHHGVLLRLRPRDLQNALPRFWSSGTEKFKHVLQISLFIIYWIVGLKWLEKTSFFLLLNKCRCTEGLWQYDMNSNLKNLLTRCAMIIMVSSI